MKTVCRFCRKSNFFKHGKQIVPIQFLNQNLNYQFLPDKNSIVVQLADVSFFENAILFRLSGAIIIIDSSFVFLEILFKLSKIVI